MIKKIAAYDFDKTLFDSPESEEGKKKWEEKKGEKYPHIGWWGRKESLDVDVFNIKPIPSVLKLAERDISDEETYTVILTARMEKLRPALEKVIEESDLELDQIIMKKGKRKKSDEILRLVKQIPDLKEIDVYDDMVKHVEDYKSIIDELPEGVEFNIYLVEEGKVSLCESTNILKKMIAEELKINF